MEQGLKSFTLAQGVNLSLAYCVQPGPNLGQPQENGLHRTLNMHRMPSTQGNQGTFIQQVSL
jgi:hypothetical protein